MATVPPNGFTLYNESTTSILLPADPAEPTKPKDVFVNPVQEYNRDLSIAVIRAWADVLDGEKKERWTRQLAKKAAKKGKRKAVQEEEEQAPEAQKRARVDGDETMDDPAPLAPAAPTTNGTGPSYRPYKFTVLEALSATGLRAIRYAKELPSLRWVLANDLSAHATQAIARNVEFNELNEPKDAVDGAPSQPKVRVNQGDACAVLYSHRAPGEQFDMVDLDPYGTAAPFLDGAVQAVCDGGLLAVTCTDLAVLASNQHLEKCFANYGGASMKAEYSHECALRLVLHAISTSASRYGRYIVPLVSLSIDFYVRLFVRVYTGALETKKALTNTALNYVCVQCGASHLQPLGRSVERPAKNGTTVNMTFHAVHGPPPGTCSTSAHADAARCPECHGRFHVGGPMWSGPLHSPPFISKVLDSLNASTDLPPLKTKQRIEGMLSLAKAELSTPFFFSPARLAGTFHSTSPPLNLIASALLNAGHKVSRSHCVPGSVKTDAPTVLIHDLMRRWIDDHPVKMGNIPEQSPARALLAKPRTHDVKLVLHPDVAKAMQTNVKLVRYQENPEAHWGPKAKARS